MNSQSVLLIEPYYSGSHKVLMDLLYEELKSKESDEGFKVHLATLPGKKFHWRARTSAIYFAQNLPYENFTCIFVSSVLPLHELLGVRPDLQQAKKIIYFHENQLVYPVRKSKDRDFQYGYNQIMSCLAADRVFFNSKYNRDSFLNNIQSFFKLQPDFRPKNIVKEIEHKCFILYFPLEFQKMYEAIGISEKDLKIARSLPSEQLNEIPGNFKIVWPHRWEFDKNPDLFFRVMFRLVDEGIRNFRLYVLGESFTDNPPIFSEAQSRLKEYIAHIGFLPDKINYYKVLYESNIVVSTADHEFFGVSMMEATFFGCLPICPKKLVYPELYNYDDSLYVDEEDLFFKLRNLLTDPDKLRNSKNIFCTKFNHSPFDWRNLRSLYMEHLLNINPSK